MKLIIITVLISLMLFLKVSADSFVPEVINLGDNSDEGLDVFRPMTVCVDKDKIVAVKRNLSSAFSECDDVEPSTSKSTKYVED
jgi:hypothetical protein